VNVVIKMIHRPSCDVIVTSFFYGNLLKTVTQGCNALIKQRKFVLLIGFWVGNKEQYILVVFWRKLHFKRWLLISKSQHILSVSSELLHEIYWCHRDVTCWSHDLHFISISYLAWACYRSQISLWLVKQISVDIISHRFPPLTTFRSQGLGKIILYTFCPSPPLCNVDKTLSSNSSLHFTIFQHWKWEWGCWHLFCRYY